MPGGAVALEPSIAKQQTKKERQRKKPDARWKTGYSIRDHPHRQIEMKFCMVGGLREIVLRFKFHQNRLIGFPAVGVKICPSPPIWPSAYTAACTIVQAVT